MEELELTSDNPFALGYLVDYGDGTFTLEADMPIYPIEIGDEYYEVIEGDTLDTIAFEKYNNSKLWHVIGNANNILNPFEPLSPGVTLRIPNPGKINLS